MAVQVLDVDSGAGEKTTAVIEALGTDAEVVEKTTSVKCTMVVTFTMEMYTRQEDTRGVVLTPRHQDAAIDSDAHPKIWRITESFVKDFNGM